MRIGGVLTRPDERCVQEVRSPDPNLTPASSAPGTAPSVRRATTMQTRRRRWVLHGARGA